MGAAWANTIAYATLALVTVGFSIRVYPIRYEWVRLAKIAVAGAAAYATAAWVVPRGLPAFLGFLLHGTVTVIAYVSLLYAAGFLNRPELAALAEIRQRALSRKGVKVPVAPSDPAPVEMAGEILAPEPDRGTVTLGDETVAGSQPKR
jgi:hypothetical protein